jgi:protocatechuate 3,4-dioxygenase beta subunit
MILLLLVLTLPGRQLPTEGALEVILRDADTRMPIPGAPVRLTFFKTPTPYPVTELKTDENGRVAFQPLAPGNYAVSAQPDGYPTTPPRDGPGHVFTVGGNTLKHHVELARSRGARLTGRVVDPQGNPIANDADVRAFRLVYYEGRQRFMSAGAPLAAAKTNALGEYQIDGIMPGEYYIRVELHPERRVSALDKFPRITYYPGTVDPRKATKISVRGNEEIVSIDVQMPNRDGIKISGTVVKRPVAVGNPLPAPSASRGPTTFYVTQYLTPADPNSLEEPLLLTSRRATRTNPDEFGFDIDGISRGVYYLDSYTNVSSGYVDWNRTFVSVADRDIEDLRIFFKPAPEIKGRVVATDSPGIAWADVRIAVRERDTVPRPLQFGGPVTPNPRTGEFTFSGLTENIRFSPVLTGLPPDFYIADLRQGGRSVYNEGVVQSNPSAGPIEIVVAPLGGTVQVVLKNSSGQVLPFSVVRLVPLGVRRTNLLLYKGVGTGADGQFTIRGVAPGDYKLFAWQPNPHAGAEESAQFLAEYESRGTPVRVTAGYTTSAEVVQIPLRW